MKSRNDFMHKKFLGQKKFIKFFWPSNSAKNLSRTEQKGKGHIKNIKSYASSEVTGLDVLSVLL